MNHHHLHHSTPKPGSSTDTPSSPVKQTFPVEGMSCASCAVSVESILKTHEGVRSAAVNFANATVQVAFDPAETSASDLKKAVQSIGYDLVIDSKPEGGSEADDDHAHHHHGTADLKRNTLWAIALALPTVVIGMFLMHMPYAEPLMWGLSTPVLFVFGRQFFVNAWKQARHGRANMDTLVALSTGIAYVFSAFNILYPQFWTSRGLEAHVYFEAAAVIIAFILLGRWMEERAKSGASSAIKKLMGMRPKTVVRIADDGSETSVPIADVEVGDLLLVRPGDHIPVDAEVADGSSFVDESMISGEPIPVEKKLGAQVYAGTVNQKGALRVKAKKVGSETVLAQIIRLVEEAQGSKAPVQRLVDRVAAIFVPVVIVIAVLSLIVWTVFGGENAFSQGLMAMITVLVIACPCALGLATPTAVMVGVGRAAENGILIKDAESLEKARQITHLVLDKTGTITQGRPAVVGERWVEGAQADTTQRQKAALVAIERQSEHPLAEAVVARLSQEGLESAKVEGFVSLTGSGVMAKVYRDTYWVGNRKLMDEQKVSVDVSLEKAADGWTSEAHTVVWFAKGKEALAVLAVADPMKETSQKAVRELQEAGIEVHMLTGDTQQAGEAVARKLGVRHVKGGVMPSDKGDYVKALQAKGNIVAMVGDGINDSEALALADVSVAMGKGTDVAMDVAAMTLISSDLALLPKALHLSDRTVRTIRQNLFWAFIYNVIGIPIAAGVLYPFTGFLLNPMIAGAAMALSSVSVVMNSLRLKYARI